MDSQKGHYIDYWLPFFLKEVCMGFNVSLGEGTCFFPVSRD